MNAIFVIQFMITDFMYIKAEHEKIYINALAHEHCLSHRHFSGPQSAFGSESDCLTTYPGVVRVPYFPAD